MEVWVCFYVSNLVGNPQLLFMEWLKEWISGNCCFVDGLPPATWAYVVGLYDKFIMIIVDCIIDYELRSCIEMTYSVLSILRCYLLVVKRGNPQTIISDCTLQSYNCPIRTRHAFHLLYQQFVWPYLSFRNVSYFSVELSTFLKEGTSIIAEALDIRNCHCKHHLWTGLKIQPIHVHVQLRT